MNPREKLSEFLGGPLFTVGDTVLTIGTFALVLLILIASFWLSRLVRKATARAFYNRLTTDEQAVNIYSRLVGALVFFAGIAFALRTAGLELTALFAAGGVFARGGVASRRQPPTSIRIS